MRPAVLTRNVLTVTHSCHPHPARMNAPPSPIKGGRKAVGSHFVRSWFVWMTLWTVLACGRSEKSEKPNPGVLALVGGESISPRELDVFLLAHRIQDASAQARADALQKLIDQTLLRQKAEELGLAISDEELAQEASRPRDTQVVDADSLRDQLKAQKAMARLVGPIGVTDDEVKSHYEGHRSEFERPLQLRLSRHAVAVPMSATPALERQLSAQSRALAAAWRKRAPQTRNTQDRVAAAPSPDAERWWTGSELAGRYPALVTLKSGQVSDPVRTNEGYEVFKVLERIDPTVAPLELVAEQLRQQLVATKRAQAARRVLQDLRIRSEVRVL